MTDALPLRAATIDDHPALAELFAGSFLHDVEEESVDRHRLVFEPDRTHLIEDAGAPVATGAIFTRDMTVPGAVVPAAHVTGVAVAATHRRRGLLTRIMHAQLDSIRERGTEPLAVLWASEGGIYGRFGYGISARHYEHTINRSLVQVTGPAPSGTLVQAKPADVAEELAAVFESVRTERPGWSSRPGKWWDWLLTDIASHRRGWSSMRAVLYREADRPAPGGASAGRNDAGGSAAGPAGYALWRVKSGWDETGPAGEVKVVQVVAANPDAYRALWRFLTSVDLTRSVTYMFGAADEPLAYTVSDPNALNVSADTSLWVRIADVPAALSARRYAAPVDVVLDVTDELVPDNSRRWRLVGDGSSVLCEPTSDEADLALDVRELGAVYLGGTSLQSLAAAGLVTEHREGALARASTAFGWHRAPSAIEIF